MRIKKKLFEMTFETTRTTLLQQLTSCEDPWIHAVAERGLHNPETADAAFRAALTHSTVPEYLRRACRAALGIPEPGLCTPVPLELT